MVVFAIRTTAYAFLTSGVTVNASKSTYQKYTLTSRHHMPLLAIVVQRIHVDLTRPHSTTSVCAFMQYAIAWVDHCQAASRSHTKRL